MKKLIALLLAVLMLLAVFAACGKDETPAPAADDSSADAPAASSGAGEDSAPVDIADDYSEEEIVINFLGAQYSDATEGYIQSVIDAFEKEHPNVKVNLEIVGWDNINMRINSMVGAQQAPDLYNGGSAADFVGDDLLYKAEDVISPELKADFFETFWNNNITPGLNECYQIPYLASVRALYYNKTIFEEVGIKEAPVTWKDVEETCQKIKDYYNGGVFPWGIDASMAEGVSTVAYYGWNNGGGYVDDNGDWILNCPENVEAFEWIKSLYDNGYTNENPAMETRDDMQKLVANDKMAMLITANFFPALYPDVELGIAPLPYNDANVSESSTMAVQDALVFFNSSAKAGEDTPEKMAALRDFVDFFYSAEYYVPFMIQEGLLPATISGAEKLVQDNPEQAAYLDALNGAKFYPRSKQNWQDCDAGCYEAAQKVITGMQSAQDALDEVQMTLEEG